MTRVQTPQGVGVLTTYLRSDGYTQRAAVGVSIVGLPFIPYNAETMPIVKDEPRHGIGVDAWMRAHSNDETRKVNDRRVAKWRKAATTPSKLRADKLIGVHVSDEAVISAKIHGGYVVEHQAAGYLELVTPRQARERAERYTAFAGK